MRGRALKLVAQSSGLTTVRRDCFSLETENERGPKDRMAKDVIRIHGEQVVVGEGTARAYRGTKWALTTVAICLAIIAVLLVVSLWWSAGN
jgi:hypothetical protein